MTTTTTIKKLKIIIITNLVKMPKSQKKQEFSLQQQQ